MNQLPTVKNFSFLGQTILTQIKRTDSVAMYSRAKEGKAPDGFEVFKIVVKGDNEEFPPPHEYGKTAFFVKSVDEAEKVFTSLQH